MTRLFRHARERSHHLLERKLLVQVTLPGVLALIQIGVAINDIARSQAEPVTLLWLVGALGVGFAFGRAVRVDWDADATQVALLGGQILLGLVYALVSIG